MTRRVILCFEIDQDDFEDRFNHGNSFTEDSVNERRAETTLEQLLSEFGYKCGGHSLSYSMFKME